MRVPVIATSAGTAATTPCGDSPRRVPYFDGLRGLGAVIVLLTHLSVSLYPSLTSGQDDVSGVHILTHFARSPLDLLTSGNFAVAIFFVLSGYVMSMLACRSKESLLGLSLRRYIRLAGPSAASCLLSAGLLLAGLYYNQKVAAFTDSSWLRQWFDFSGSLSAALHEGLIGIFEIPNSIYNANLWTMYTELWGSLAIFVLHRGIGPRLLRLVVILLMAGIAFVYFRQFGFFCIFAGSASYLVYDILHAEGTGAARRWLWPLVVLHRPAIAVPAVMMGLYFGSYPDFGVFNDPGVLYRWLRATSTLWVYGYHALGAVLVVHYVHRAPPFRAIFAKWPLLYLGRISFPLYLVHLPIICSFGAWLIARLHGEISYNAMAITVAVATTICSFGVAELFSRTVDRPCLALGPYVARQIDHRLRGRRLLIDLPADP
jgi:peptidoglycan/LPS O-acetylase OafA/YrhL